MQERGTWTSGEFSGVLRGRYELLWLVAALGVLLWLAADRITILGRGEAQARSLGLDYRQTLVLGLGIVSVTVAVVVVTQVMMVQARMNFNLVYQKILNNLIVYPYLNYFLNKLLNKKLF